MHKIVSHREFTKDDMDTYAEVIFSNNGVREETFRKVMAKLEDGTECTAWVADRKHSGYFKRVFVPWDVEHPEIV